MSRSERRLLPFILLLAFALRIWAIDAQGIWGDEAFSIYTAAQPLSYVLSGGADVHPPLYHVLLHFWLDLAGRSPLAVRFLSAWWSLLVVAAGFHLARLSLPRTALPGVPSGPAPLASNDALRTEPAPERSFSSVPLLAAFLLAISPFQVYYAQETRMYMQAAALCTLSLLFFMRWNGGARKTLLPWFAVTLLALYTHYFAFFILAAQDLYLLLAAWRARHAQRFGLLPIAEQRSKPLAILADEKPSAGVAAESHSLPTTALRTAIAAQALMALFYVPWLVVQSDYLRSHANGRTSTLSLSGIGDVLGQSLGALFIGATIDGPARLAFALLCLASAALGFLAARKSPRAPLLLLCIVIPIAGAIAVNPLLAYFRERFLLIASPAFVVLMAYGINALATAPGRRFTRPIYMLSIISFALIAALALGSYRFDPRNHKGEYDQAIAAIRAEAKPGDAVLIYTPIQEALYDYYRIDGLRAYALPKADLDAVSAQHPRAWLLLYGDPAVYDPSHAAEAYLSARGFKSFYQSYRDGALARYDFAPGAGALGGARITFGVAIVLTGFSLPPSAPRGSTVPVILQWQASRISAANYTVFVHLLGADGKVAAQMDTQPAGGTRPTGTWLPGETVRDNIGVALPASVPPGAYRVEIGMYDLLTLRRLLVADPDGRPIQDDAVRIGAIEIR